MNCLIIYTSMSGNTEDMANAISQGLLSAGIDVEIKDSLLSFPEELLKYDGIIIGSYTWSDGDLPDEFIDFYEEMEQLDLSGKKAAAFGSGSSTYSYFCQAVDTLNERFKELGAEIILPGLKIEESPNEIEINYCKEFGQDFGEKLLKNELAS